MYFNDDEESVELIQYFDDGNVPEEANAYPEEPEIEETPTVQQDDSGSLYQEAIAGNIQIEYPRKSRVFGHFFHWHVAVHYDRFHGFGKDSSF